MKTRLKFIAAVAILAVIGMGTAAVADNGRERETLTGYEEVPALSTPGVGDFRLDVARSRRRSMSSLMEESLAM